MPPKHLALLRGINVGGKNMLPMKDLVAIFTAEGCSNVQHFIQSGNILFDIPTKRPTDLATRISARILETHSLKAPVILRTAKELKQVVLANPFMREPGSTEYFYVMFLAHQPHPTAVLHLDPARSSPDEFHVVGREIYMNLPTGAGNTKLTNAYFDSKLETISTSRNWRTVLKLLELMQ
jgi:uncharacterized protein (DUF1697 family)